MDLFFITRYYQSAEIANWTYVGNNPEKAMAEFSDADEFEPCDLFRYNDSEKMLYGFNPVDDEWKPYCRMWFAVRHNPGFPYPETVISQDGIFDTLAETEAYIKEHGGSWKMYCFSELQCKMAESITLEEKLREERMKTGTDLADLPF